MHKMYFPEFLKISKLTTDILHLWISTVAVMWEHPMMRRRESCKYHYMCHKLHEIRKEWQKSEAGNSGPRISNASRNMNFSYGGTQRLVETSNKGSLFIRGVCFRQTAQIFFLNLTDRVLKRWIRLHSILKRSHQPDGSGCRWPTKY